MGLRKMKRHQGLKILGMHNSDVGRGRNPSVLHGGVNGRKLSSKFFSKEKEEYRSLDGEEARVMCELTFSFWKLGGGLREGTGSLSLHRGPLMKQGP